jgi:multisubunit Na+/H+ antiporter MnhC subunit
MNAIKILSYVFYTAILVFVICILLNFKFKYFGPIMGFVLVSSSVLLFLDAYRTRKNKS